MARRPFSLGLRSNLVLLLVLLHICTEPSNAQDDCVPSSCGNIPEIRYPFRLTNEPSHCGNMSYNLSCENNLTVWYLEAGKYYVQAINYNNYTIRVVDAGIQNDNISSIPLYPLSFTSYGVYSAIETKVTGRSCTGSHLTLMKLPGNNFTFNSPSYEDSSYTYYETKLDYSCLSRIYNHKILSFIKCQNPENSSGYVDTAPCNVIDGGNTNSASSSRYSYVMVGSPDSTLSELRDFCRIEMVTMISGLSGDNKNMSCIDIHKLLVYGVELSWLQGLFGGEKDQTCALNDSNEVLCDPTFGQEQDRYSSWLSVWNDLRAEYLYTITRNENHRLLITSFEYFLFHLTRPVYYNMFGFRHPDKVVYFLLLSTIIVLWLAAKLVLGTPCSIAVIIYKWRRRHLSMYNNIEEYLQSQNNLMPIRYSYSDIKKMTQNFKEKLGQGGFGAVYKGKLKSGSLVAVKMLNKSNANGQDFISEVATIGRIYHVNVVQLIGFCVERSKRALVYEFMPNGSLDKYIFSADKSNISLNSEKTFEISLGVARGIEYLHQGCGVRILHFDIKPHNILLDDNFIPKVSDFGLARLYPKDDSIVSLTAARGTMGYIAPELFYKNIGGVSHKADVYSFGMLLMELATQKKNWDQQAEHSSQNYFPSWVYNQFRQGIEIEIGGASKEERKIVKKMIAVALWCIQMDPTNRPSMSKVVEMLEGDVESLQVPGKPFLFSDDTPVEDLYDNTYSTSLLSTMTCESSVSIQYT